MRALSLLLGLLCLCGCATSPRNLVLDPVGPPPGASAVRGNDGSLLVYSARDPRPDFEGLPYRDRYTGYRILSADGKQVVGTVSNDDGRVLGSPSKVRLPVGRYRVQAQANGYGLVTVPVVIQPHQVTAVHLEGGYWWPRGSSIFESHPVRLPSGGIVGWAAEQRAAAPSSEGAGERSTDMAPQ